MRGLRYLSLILLSFYLLGISAAAAQSTYTFDVKNADQGIFAVNYSLEAGKKVKVMVEKDGTTLYYNLISNKTSESFPLQMGSGTYNIAVIENVTANQYKIVTKEAVTSKQKDKLNVYLQSMQLIKWKDNEALINKAKALTNNLKTDEEKVKAIYKYIVENYTYDWNKLNNLLYNYLPDNNEMLKTKKGICYDYSSLFASMLRSVNIPTKLVKGYAVNVKGYHAWNEVYINGKWKVVDTTTDSQMAAKGAKYSMYKDSGYKKVNEF